MRRIVSDAGPLISLSASGHLDLLQHVADEVLVPEQVWRECVLSDVEPVVRALRAAGWRVSESLLQRLLTH